MTFFARVLALAAGVEFLLLRLLLRLGPLLPDTAEVNSLLGWGLGLGLWSLNIAAVAGLLLLGALGQVLWQSQAPASLKGAAVLALGLSLVGMTAPFLAPVSRNPSFLLLLAPLSMVMILLVGASLVGRRSVLLPVAIISVAYLAGFYHYLARAGDAQGFPFPGGGVSLALAESLALLVSPALLLAFRPGWRPRAAVVATGVALLYGAATLAQPWMVATLLIWDFSFTSFLPSFIYALGLWLVAYTLVAFLRRPGGERVGLGLALMALGGLRLENSYFTLLALAGILLVAGALEEHSAALWRHPAALKPAHVPPASIP